MNGLFTNTDSWLPATVLAGLMLAAWLIGFRSGVRLPDHEREAMGKTFADASMAILGLLLAFTFSMALGKYDQRRQMVILDSNAIADFHTCASLVKQPIRGQCLQIVIHDYVRKRWNWQKRSKATTDWRGCWSCFRTNRIACRNSSAKRSTPARRSPNRSWTTSTR